MVECVVTEVRFFIQLEFIVVVLIRLVKLIAFICQVTKMFV